MSRRPFIGGGRDFWRLWTETLGYPPVAVVHPSNSSNSIGSKLTDDSTLNEYNEIMKFNQLPAFLQWIIFISACLAGFYLLCCLGATSWGRPLLLFLACALSFGHKLVFRSWSGVPGSHHYSRF